MRIVNPPAGHDDLSGVSTSDHHTKYSDSDAVSAVVEDAVFGSGWNGDTGHAPSQNAVYDYLASLAIPAQAVQADIENETNADTYIPADLLRFHPGVLKGRCYWEQIGAHGISNSTNWTSVTDGGAAGDTDHIIATDMTGPQYDTTFGTNYGAIHTTAKAASTFTSVTEDIGGTDTDSGDNSVILSGTSV